MDDKQTKNFRQRLLDIKSELRALDLQASESGDTVELDQSKVGRLSRMDAMQVQQMALETSRRRRQQLQRIDGALRRIENGDFGLCFVCGDEIDERRLLIDPTASRCMDCVEK